MKIELESKYQNWPIHLDFTSINKHCEIVSVFMHGAFGESGDNGSKSKILGDLLVKNEISHVLNISTARNWALYKTQTFNDCHTSFDGKTFDMERQDYIDGIDYLLNNSKSLTGCSSIKMYLVTNSIGGLIASTLYKKYINILKVAICSSGITSLMKDKPIGPSVWPIPQIVEIASSYKGEMFALEGSEDSVVPHNLQEQLYNAYIKARKSKKIIEGANHNFSAIFGKDKEIANKIYVDETYRFLIS